MALTTRRFLILALVLLFLPLPVFAQQNEPRTEGSDDRDAKRAAVEAQTDEDTYQQLTLFGEVFERVRASYVDPVTDKELIEHALNGMLANLDPHSSYLTEKDFGDMQVQTKGEFGGLGIEVTMEEGLVKVVSPIDDTPAFKAGIQAGDYITHIDDEPVMGMTLNDAVDKMRGKVGTNVTLTIRREGVKDSLKIRLKRDVIRIRAVRHEIKQNDIGYIRVTTFNQNTVEGVETAIADITRQIGKDKVMGFILDLRNNPGGLLDQAIGLADLFLDKGEIVSTRGRHEEDTKRDNATPGDLTAAKPIVVLINGGSASASEIVAGALQDHQRAILLGTKTFGKGSVQTVIPLPGNGAMRLTTARYYTPSGRSIQAKGIEPDIVVEQAKIEEITPQDEIHERDLPGALDKEQQGEKESKPKKEESSNETPKPQGDAGDKPAAEVQDYQLLRAIDLIRGVSLYEDRFSKRQ